MHLDLHIGTEKTGTTSIQKFLYLNRSTLLSAGILVPQSLGKYNHRVLSAISNDDDVFDDFYRSKQLTTPYQRSMAKQRWLGEFINEIENSDAEKCIISSEHLQSRLRHPKEIQRLYKLLHPKFSSIHIILYIRRPILTAISLYSTSIKCGSLASKIPSPDNPYYRHVVDHANTIKMWEHSFPNSDFSVRIFEKESLASGNVIDDFIMQCKLPDLFYDRPGVVNKSLSYLGLELLRRVNKSIPRYLQDGAVCPARSGLVEFFEENFTAGQSLVPSKELIDSYDYELAVSDEWVRNQFFPERDSLFKPYFVDKDPSQSLDDATMDELAAAFVELWRLHLGTRNNKKTTLSVKSLLRFFKWS